MYFRLQNLEFSAYCYSFEFSAIFFCWFSFNFSKIGAIADAVKVLSSEQQDFFEGLTE